MMEFDAIILLVWYLPSFQYLRSFSLSECKWFSPSAVLIEGKHLLLFQIFPWFPPLSLRIWAFMHSAGACLDQNPLDLSYLLDKHSDKHSDPIKHSCLSWSRKKFDLWSNSASYWVVSSWLKDCFPGTYLSRACQVIKLS